MADNELDTMIKEQDLVGDDFFEASSNFWFRDNEQISNQFPEKIQPELKELT